MVLKGYTWMRLLFHIWGYFNISLTTDKPLITMHLLYTAKVEWSSKNVATRKFLCPLDLCCCCRTEDGFQNVALLGPRVGGHMGIWYMRDMHQTIASKCWAYHLLLMQPENTCRIDPIWHTLYDSCLHDMNNENGFLQGRCHDMKSWKIHWFV